MTPFVLSFTCGPDVPGKGWALLQHIDILVEDTKHGCIQLMHYIACPVVKTAIKETKKGECNVGSTPVGWLGQPLEWWIFEEGLAGGPGVSLMVLVDEGFHACVNWHRGCWGHAQCVHWAARRHYGRSSLHGGMKQK